MKKMLKRADGSTSRRGLWDNMRAKAAANKKAGKKGKAPSDAMLEAEDSIKAEQRMGGNWLKDSQELKFGGVSKKKYQTAGASMDTKAALGQVFQGKMTAAQGNAAIGKPAPTAQQTEQFKAQLAAYGKKRMGGKNC